MIRMTILLFAVFLAACSSNSIEGTPEYQAKKAQEDGQKAAGEKNLFAKVDEFASMKPPKKEVRPYAVGSSSAVVLTKMPSGDYEMEGWKKEADGSYRRCLESAGCKAGHPNVITDYFRAESADKAKTLVRVKCDKGKEITDLQGEFSYGALYGVSCLVDVIDLPTNAMIASKEFTVDKVGTVGETKIVSSSDYIKPVSPEKDYLANPFPAISDFVRELDKK